MLLRANAFASNYLAPQVEVLDRLLAFVNAGIHRVMPQKGSGGGGGEDWQVGLSERIVACNKRKRITASGGSTLASPVHVRRMVYCAQLLHLTESTPAPHPPAGTRLS